MDSNVMLSAINALSVNERLQLVDAIMEGIDAEQGPIELTEEFKRELDRRIAEDEANPGNGVSWEDLQAELAARSKK